MRLGTGGPLEALVSLRVKVGLGLGGPLGVLVSMGGGVKARLTEDRQR